MAVIVQPSAGPSHVGALTSGALMNSDDVSSNLLDADSNLLDADSFASAEHTERDEPVAAASLGASGAKSKTPPRLKKA